MLYYPYIEIGVITYELCHVIGLLDNLQIALLESGYQIPLYVKQYCELSADLKAAIISKDSYNSAKQFYRNDPNHETNYIIIKKILIPWEQRLSTIWQKIPLVPKDIHQTDSQLHAWINR